MKAFLLMISLFSFSIVAVTSNTRHDRVDITPELSHAELEEVKELFLRGELAIDDIQNPAVWEFLYGGDIIGNGGGIVESNFNFIYQNLSQYIREYLVTNRKVMDMNDYVTLASIANLAKKNKDLPYKLIFIEKNEAEAVFGKNEIEHRTAMTGHYPGAPVLINRSQLYNEEGVALLDHHDIIALLTHELGHQVGVENHTYLDTLGNRVKTFVVRQSSRIVSQFNGRILIFTVKDPIESSSYFESRLIYGEDSIDISSSVKPYLDCGEGFELLNFSFSNLHWQRVEEGKYDTVSVAMWLTMQCLDIESGSLYSFDDDISLAIEL